MAKSSTMKQLRSYLQAIMDRGGAKGRRTPEIVAALKKSHRATIDKLRDELIEKALVRLVSDAAAHKLTPADGHQYEMFSIPGVPRQIEVEIGGVRKWLNPGELTVRQFREWAHRAEQKRAARANRKTRAQRLADSLTEAGIGDDSKMADALKAFADREG